MIILELVGIDCGVFKLMSLVKLRDLTHIVDRFEHCFPPANASVLPSISSKVSVVTLCSGT
jgi:hypothetical protein